MIANLIWMFFCSLLAWLLYRFPLQKATTPADYRKLLPFFCALIGFVVFNGLLAYMGMGGLSLANSSAPILELKSLAGEKSETGVILAGVVSDQNPTIYGDYVAYVDDHLWSPMELWLDLKDGRIAITNDTYRATNWPVDAMGSVYLQAKQPVIVVGFVENNLGLISGDQSQTIRAELIYAGAYQDFTARARSQLILATAIVWANAFVVLMIVLLPLRDCLRGLRG